MSEHKKIVSFKKNGWNSASIYLNCEQEYTRLLIFSCSIFLYVHISFYFNPALFLLCEYEQYLRHTDST